MDTDANVLNNALAVLRQQFGQQVAGAQKQGLGQMRQALEQQLGLDDVTADRVVKKLAETGRLRYVMTGDADDGPTGTTPVGPVASLPGVYTGSTGTGQMVVPAAQAVATAEVLGDVPTDGGILRGAEPDTATARSATAAGERQDAGEPLGSADLSWRTGENQEGVTVGGQLADTNAEGGVGMVETHGQRTDGDYDNSEGYWQIS